MIFCKVDVDFYDHPRFLAVGPEATGLWLAALAYTRKHELDGVVPLAAFLGFFGGDRERNERSRVTLCDAGLMTTEGQMIRLLGYDQKNETKAVVAERRAANAARKALSRERSRNQSRIPSRVTDHVTNAIRPGSGSVNGSGSDLSPERIQGEPAPESPGERALGSFGFELDAFVAEIVAVTGRPFARPRGETAATLADAIGTHCPPTLDRSEFARAKARSWLESKPGRLNVWTFVDFLNTGPPAAGRQRFPSRAVQPAPDAPWMKSETGT